MLRERQQQVLDLLVGLKGLDSLKKLFWEELDNERVARLYGLTREEIRIVEEASK